MVSKVGFYCLIHFYKRGKWFRSRASFLASCFLLPLLWEGCATNAMVSKVGEDSALAMRRGESARLIVGINSVGFCWKSASHTTITAAPWCRTAAGGGEAAPPTVMR